MRLMPLVLTAAAGLAAAEAVAQQDPPPVPIKEWNVPWTKTRPRDPAVAPDGKIWFVGQVGNYVARLDPATGAFKQFAIDSGTHPHNVIVDGKGRPWFAGNANGMIGRLDPAPDHHALSHARSERAGPAYPDPGP
jgi:virginiamycin B lyase